MFAKFKYDTIPLNEIQLDVRNPRIVTRSELKWQEEILQYLFDHEDLLDFIQKIALEGKNLGAERPYVVKTGNHYTVIEGNSRIAAYKVLAGIMNAPEEYAASIPKVSPAAKKELMQVDCSIAPSRDALLAIMANSHFGLGDKSKWGYLGSRKAVHDMWKAGKSISKLADVFDRTEGQIRELINEYLLYLQALDLAWTQKEKEALLKPSVQFNPPVRFLQTKGHKEKIGISYGSNTPSVTFADDEAKKRFKHLIKKLVVTPTKGLGATAKYDAVFADYPGAKEKDAAGTTSGQGGTTSSNASSSSSSAASGSGAAADGAPKLKPHALFAYPVTLSDALISQLMKEASQLNCKQFPAAGTFLLRNVMEAILKHIIYSQKANPASKVLDLEGSLNLCMSNAVTLTVPEKKLLKEFAKSHLNYLNLGAHGNVIPNHDRLMAARDCVAQFVKTNV